MVTFILLVIGGLNWLLIGLFDLDIVQKFIPGLADIIYILVGLSAVYEFITHKSSCKTCTSGESDKSEDAQSSMNHPGGQGM